MQELLLREASEFRAQAARFLAGAIDEERFRSYRVRRGIYGQRQAGLQMVRIRIPGGRVTAERLLAIAEAAERFGHGYGHITTRQDVQLYYVPLERVADAMELLARAGLTPREAGGNAVRNVTACPLAGRCPGQAFDVRPFCDAVTRRYLGSEATARLPRKFKIAFSCSRRDCGLGDINDLSAAAVLRDGTRGFRLRVGGGLGPSPQAAQTLYQFVPASDLGGVFDAVLRVFDTFTNRADRHRLRLKFLIRERGIEWFREKVADTCAAAGTDGWRVPAAAHLPAGEQVWVTAPQGNLSADQFRLLASLAEEYGDATLCFTLNQNVLVNGVSPKQTAELRQRLAAAGFLTEGAGELADVVTCPGATTCNVGLTRSMDLGAELARVLSTERDLLARQITIRVSGCPDACGHHHIGNIGLFGSARKLNGDAAPFYQVLVGGGRSGGGTRFGRHIGAVAARQAPQAVRRIITFYKAERLPQETFLEFVDRRGIAAFHRELAAIADHAVEEVLIDWGAQGKFTVQVGRSECSA
jgi:sulfite reductase beta subunit-like hemoprotein